MRKKFAREELWNAYIDNSPGNLALDKLCESGEVDRRTAVFRMLVCGYSDAAIAVELGIPIAEIDGYRPTLPKWWRKHMVKTNQANDKEKKKMPTAAELRAAIQAKKSAPPKPVAVIPPTGGGGTAPPTTPKPRRPPKPAPANGKPKAAPKIAPPMQSRTPKVGESYYPLQDNAYTEFAESKTPAQDKAIPIIEVIGPLKNELNHPKRWEIRAGSFAEPVGCEWSAKLKCWCEKRYIPPPQVAGPKKAKKRKYSDELKGRLPHGSQYLKIYDGENKEWRVTLTIPDGGAPDGLRTFWGEASGSMRAEHHADTAYRNFLAAIPVAEPEKADAL